MHIGLVTLSLRGARNKKLHLSLVSKLNFKVLFVEYVRYIRLLLTESRLAPKETYKLIRDNKETISIPKNPIQHDQTKHIEFDKHFSKEKLEAEICRSSDLKINWQIYYQR